MPLNCNVEIASEFFLELNAKHIHGGKNEGITSCVSECLGACICLSNIYTSHTRLIHAFRLFSQKLAFCCSFCKFKKREDPCMCCVYVRQTYTRL